jgi:uncharacterized protein with PQ loop repeat
MSEPGAESLYPSARAEPELGGGANSSDVVATLEMTEITPIHELKLEPTWETKEPKFGPTVVALPVAEHQHQQQQFLQQPDVQAIVAMQLEQKEGAICCGCCCDYRRAVIIGNSFFIGFALFTTLLESSGPALMEATYTDDEFIEDVSVVLDEYFVSRIIFLGIAILTSIVAIAGAVHYQIWLVGFHAFWLVVDFIAYVILLLAMIEDLDPTYAEKDLAARSPVSNFVFVACLTAIFIYAHLGFIIEVRAGILTHETYPREEYSCCCHRRPPRRY